MAQSDDTTPPTLVALSFGAASVNVSAAAQNLTVNATITDDLSGVNYGYIYFTSPSGQFEYAFFTRTSGGDLNGGYQAAVAFPLFAEPGVWTAYVYLQDNAGNSVQLQSATLVSLGFPGTLTVVDSNPDTTPPTLLGASFSPSTINTSAGPQSITVSLQVADSQSGVSFSNSSDSFALLSRTGGGDASLELSSSNFTLVSGTAQNGVWQATLTMPQYSGGDWMFTEVALYDADTNRVYLTAAQLAAMGISPVLADTSVPADVTPPRLTGLSFAPSVVDTSASSQNVTVTLSASDDISGVYLGLFNNTYIGTYAYFQSPSGNQNVYAYGYIYPAPIAGTPLAGTWQLTAQWPQFSEQGTWNLLYLYLYDAVGNYVYYNPTQLQELGFPSNIVIEYPSLIPDGTIGPAGGTVDDSAFGSRASVTFPPGLVSSPTTVSIDVFASPLSVPTPRGFTMPGTYFENLSFSPDLTEPIPAPGITIVLPLLTPMTPGAQLSLYHIDPIIGLAPAMNASGQPVLGTVNAGGLSATFNNVVTFSTVVAYLSTGSVLGDVNGDGVVNCADVSIVKNSFGTHTGQPGFNVAADLNNDGTVNILDLFIVSRQLASGTVCH
jgi:serine protease